MTSGVGSGDGRRVHPDADGIARAARVLKGGGLCSFPTETVYGLGADATNDDAVAGIYEAKGRPSFNPLIVHVADADKARKVSVFNSTANELAEQFWPGSLTLVLPRRDDAGLSGLVSAGLDTVAVRAPNHPVAFDLLKSSGCSIAAPSANKSGDVSPTTAQHVLSAWDVNETPAPSVVLDGGACPVGLESTVLDLTSPIPILLRHGGLTVDELTTVCPDLKIADGSPDKPRSPGMLARHYAPSSRVILNACRGLPDGVFLGFGEHSGDADLSLSPSGNLREAAANLFAMMRELDSRAPQTISVAPIPETGLGMAINDRLRRAATRGPS